MDTDRTAAEREKGRLAGIPEGVAIGIQSERARIGAILSHAEAEGREQLARTFAFDTDMTVDQVAALLKVAPKASARVLPLHGQRACETPYGLVIDTTAQDETAAHGWSKAVAEANQRVTGN